MYYSIGKQRSLRWELACEQRPSKGWGESCELWEGETFRRKEIAHAKATVKHAGNREVTVVEIEFGEDSRRGLLRGMCLEVL